MKDLLNTKKSKMTKGDTPPTLAIERREEMKKELNKRC
jgi:hypothetical protein